jgi:DNA-binding GntR family transcriptional regulator
LATGNGRQYGTDKLSPNVYEHAYNRLVSILLSGTYKPNTRLTEAELTQMLNVSRGTVRSVLVRLAQEGYVTSEVNRGVRTRLFSVADAVDILEAREVLEGALAAKAAERATQEELDDLKRTVALMCELQLAGDQNEYSRQNRNFHQQIRRAAHQETLARFFDALLYPLVMRQYRDIEAPHPRIGSLEEHQAILSAIITRNPEAASATMRHHISSARQGLLLRNAADGGDPESPPQRS